MRTLLTIGALALTGCNAGPFSAPVDLTALHGAHDWGNEPGADLQRAFARGASSALRPTTRAQALEALAAADYECQFGEAHQDYPDPMAVCARSFATRACQLDWEIASTADKGRVADVEATFRRDCVGVDRDWPAPVRSAIDEQLAPASEP